MLQSQHGTCTIICKEIGEEGSTCCYSCGWDKWPKWKAGGRGFYLNVFNVRDKNLGMMRVIAEWNTEWLHAWKKVLEHQLCSWHWNKNLMGKITFYFLSFIWLIEVLNKYLIKWQRYDLFRFKWFNFVCQLSDILPADQDVFKHNPAIDKSHMSTNSDPVKLLNYVERI